MNTTQASNYTTTHSASVGCVERSGIGFVSGGSVFNSDIALLLCQIAVIMVLSRTLGLLFNYIKEPLVIAEFISGIILGPTALGKIPAFTDAIFPASSIPLLDIVAQLAVFLFMFLVGLQLDLEIVKKSWGKAAIVTVVGEIGGIAAAFPVAALMNSSEFKEDGRSWGVFAFFLGLVMAVSALPVLARILSEFGLMNTRVGILILTETMLDDFFSWPLVAIAIAVSGISSPISILWTVLLLLADAILVMFGIRYLFIFLLKKNGE